MGEKLNSYKGYKMLIFIAYFCMTILGIIGTLKGASIPSIRVEFAVDYEQIGSMLFMGMLGGLTATFFGGLLIERHGLKRIFLFGISMAIISSGLFYVVPSFIGVVMVHFLLGLGLGSFQIGLNALGGKVFVKNAAMMMSLLHLFFGLGASIAPRLAGAIISNGYSWKFTYLAAIILLLVLLVMVIFTKFPEASKEVKNKETSFKELAKSSKVWLIALILGLFGLMEGGIGDWLVNYLREARAFDIALSTSYLTGFYMTFTFGRLVGGFIADRLGYIKALIYFSVTATLILFVGIILGNRYVVLFSVMGFFTSISFPTMMVIIMKEYKNSVGAVMGFVITIEGFIGLVGTRLIGSINELWGVTAGMVSLGVFGIVASMLLLLLSKQLKQA